jgi:cell wall-associated NlpC family hydrolase
MVARPNALPLFLVLSLFLSGCSAFKKKPDYPTYPVTPPPKEDRLRSGIVQEARKQLGIPYKYAGKSPRTGFDCSGLIFYVMNRFDISVSPASRIMANEGREIRIQQVRPGDIIYYKRSAMGPVFHVSLVVSNDPNGIRVIHSVSRGVVEENITKSSYWKPKIAGARSILAP